MRQLGGSITSQRLFEALVSSETVTSSHVLLSQCFRAIQESIAGNKAHRSDFAYKLLRLMPCQNIKRSQERTKLVKLLEDAGIGNVAEDTDSARSKPEGNALYQEFGFLASAIATRQDARPVYPRSRHLRAPLPCTRPRKAHAGHSQPV